jgi:hypothetical protein
VVIRELLKMHNDEFHNFYSSPYKISTIKSKRIKFTGQVARIEVRRGEGEFIIGHWWENQKEMDH